MRTEVVCADPMILLVHDFISEVEVGHLLSLANGSFQDSRITCDKPEGCVSDHRTSSSAYLMSPDWITQGISNRGIKFACIDRAIPEDLQIVRYLPGQEFKAHFDVATKDTPTGKFEYAWFGALRMATLLVYLNDDFEGGGTHFPRLGLRVRPVKNAALYWRNLLPDGRLDARTWHGGEPVTSGVKYACNVWLRGSQEAGTLSGMNASPLGLGRPGRLGKFEPSLEADAKRFGVAVDQRPYVLGSKGVRMTLQEMGRMIREGSISPAMRQFAEGIIRDAGVGVTDKLTDKRAAQIILDYVRTHVRYRPDPDQVEYVQAAAITLCVPGAAMCIPVEDCDGLTVALGTLYAAYGICVKMMKQTYGSDDQEHVLVIFRDESGKWLAADPSAPHGTPVGWRTNATKEITVDPSDPSTLDLVDAPEARYVGVGRLPSNRVVFLGAEVTSVTQASIDLANQFEAVVLAADSVMTASPSEYSTAVEMYQAGGSAAVTSLGPEIDSTDPSGGTKSFTQTAWNLNALLANVNATNSTEADAVSAQSYAHQMLLLYQQALSARYTSQVYKRETRGTTVSVGDAVVGTAMVAFAGGFLWALLKPQPQRAGARR